MKAIGVALLLWIMLPGTTEAYPPEDTTTVTRPAEGGIYDRPYILRPSSAIAIGGYAEGVFRTEYAAGVHEGSGFEFRRFNIFIFSSIARNIRFTSELEFEHGTEEIKLETALIDFQFANAFNARAGVLLSPIGKFNLAHDSPRNEFNDRPLVSTRIIPATLSEAGAGLFGSLYPVGDHRLTYELYAVNGLNDGVIVAGEGTDIPSGRPESFDGDNNASPSLVGRIAFMPDFGGELGFSAHSGLYNTFEAEGVEVDEKRGLTIVAVDAEYRWNNLSLQGEFAAARIEIPQSLVGLYAQNQRGFYGQAVYQLFQGLSQMFPQSTLSVGVRYDAIDLDAGITGDENFRLTAGIGIRPVPDTLIKLDYQHNWIFDRVNNETRSAALQFGLATYF
jgi:hypothetical protein